MMTIDHDISQNKYLFRLLQIGFALTTMGMKWMIGVVLRKLLDTGLFFPSSSSSEHHPSEQATTLEKNNKLLDFVFLLDTSFHTVVGIAFGIIFINILCTASLTAMAVHRSSYKGRTLRNQIVTKSVESPTACAAGAGAGAGGGTMQDSSSSLNRTANDLIVHVKLLEDFTEFDEHWLVVNYIIIALAVLLSLVFAWQAGLVALGCFACSVLVLEIFERIRKSTVLTTIEQANQNVNARLLDVVRNGVKIKLTHQLEQERQALQKLEASSDVARTQNARLKFFREIFRQYALAVIPILMSLLAWELIQMQQHQQQSALDMGSAVLVAILLLDEAHKAFMHNAFISDKQVGAIEAQTAIDTFLGGDGTDISAAMMQEGNQQDDDQKTKSQPSSISSESKSSSITKQTKPYNKTLCNSSADTNLEDDWEDDDCNSTMIFASDDRDIESNYGDRNSNSNNKGRQGDQNSSIVLDHIGFRYPGRDLQVLGDYSHSFQRGQIHGLVGESGSGKSSLLKIIAQLIQPNSGNLYHWEGIRIAYVSQDQKLFARSIRENVTYGAPTPPPTDDQIWAALKAANLHEWVSSLPSQLDQVLIRGEVDVSGGQLQRLNLAHLFCVCQTSDLILLDEVLSALDQKSRTILLEQIQQFLRPEAEAGTTTAKKTAIIITHHSEMLTICDQVHEMPAATLLSSTNDLISRECDSAECLLADTTDDSLESEVY